jgi:2-polyprenyl-6-methoxyphenol hydroxylase-like FAD-dependent oxidoreductase
MPIRTIAIVGCGPAGLAAALFLRSDGHRVTLFDQFPEPRPIGSGLMLQPTGLAVLAALGLQQAIAAHGTVIHRMCGKAVPSGRTVLDVAYDPAGLGRHGLAVHRSALFGVLYREVLKQGIAIETSRRITAVDPSGHGGAALIDDNGRSHGPFDLVVDAGGLRSPLSADARAGARMRQLPFGALWASLRWPGAPFADHQLEQRYRRADMMVGVLPIGRPDLTQERQAAFFWSLPADGYDAWRAAGLEIWKDQVRSIWPETDVFLRQITDADQLTMARYCHVTLRNPYGAAVAHIGDSAHATSPQLGQGANMALLDAAALACAMRERSEIDQALLRYHQLRRMHVTLYQAVSAIFTPFYQSAGPLLPVIRDHILWPLSRVPPAPAILSALARGQLIDPLPALGLSGSLAALDTDNRHAAPTR